MVGDGEGNMNFVAPLTRAHLATILARIHGGSEQVESNRVFYAASANFRMSLTGPGSMSATAPIMASWLGTAENFSGQRTCDACGRLYRDPAVSGSAGLDVGLQQRLQRRL